MTAKELVIGRLERRSASITLEEIREDVKFLIAMCDPDDEEQVGIFEERIVSSPRLHLADSLPEFVEMVLKRLPADASLRDLIDELEEMEAVEEGCRDIDEGRVMTLEELRRQTEPCITK